MPPGAPSRVRRPCGGGDRTRASGRTGSGREGGGGGPSGGKQHRPVGTRAASDTVEAASGQPNRPPKEELCEGNGVKSAIHRPPTHHRHRPSAAGGSPEPSPAGPRSRCPQIKGFRRPRPCNTMPLVPAPPVIWPAARAPRSPLFNQHPAGLGLGRTAEEARPRKAEAASGGVHADAVDSAA